MPFAAEKIRVGRDYQAVCPELEPVDQRKPEQMSDRALLVWSPTADISDAKCKLCEMNSCLYSYDIMNLSKKCMLSLFLLSL